MFQIATVPRMGLNTHLLVLLLDKEYVKKRQKDLRRFPPEIRDTLKEYFAKKDFKGDFKETAVVYPQSGTTIDRILLVGVGESNHHNSDAIRTIGGVISERQRHLRAQRVHILICNICFPLEEFIRGFAEGVYFQRYQFDVYKSEKKKREPRATFVFVCDKSEYTPKFRRILKETNAVMEGVRIARNLANHPSNGMTPALLKNYVQQHFKNDSHFTFKALNEKEMKSLGMNALLAVARGSSEAPYLISLTYTPARKTKKTLVLVGKGVTFDSGGISIKPSANMEEMKYDMSGAAAVVGIMETVRLLKPNFKVVALLPAVENMPGGSAVKPGDIVTAHNGTTIEIINTDAEGRLILADALSYADTTCNPGLMIDFATLTGACVVALGDKRAGLFTKNEMYRQMIMDAGEASGDRVWPMPMDDLYDKELESQTADIKNIGGRWGGAITAAKFLEHFTGKRNWVHIDIAGTAYDVKHREFLGKGATGFGPRLIGGLLKKFEKTL